MIQNILNYLSAKYSRLFVIFASLILLFMIRKFITICLLSLLSQTQLFAQNLSTPYDFKPQQLILPAALLAAASTTFYISEVEQFDHYLESEIGTRFGALHYDDYMQFATIATMWALDACNIPSRHEFREQSTILMTATLSTLAMMYSGKYLIKRARPGNLEHNSFPSGHTSMAFVGAELLRLEFWDYSPWIGVAGYAFAFTTAYMRIYNNRHYLTDTIAGAGVGILGAKIGYWCAPAINKFLWGSDLRAKHLNLAITPCTIDNGYGMNLSLRF